MDERKPTEMLHRTPEIPGKTRFCPDDQLIAGMYDGGLAATQLASLRQHVASCPCCQARLGMLARLESQPSVTVPEWVLAEAKQLVRSPQARRDRRPIAWLGAAAAALAAGLALYAVFLPPDSTPAPEVPTNDFPVTRSALPRDALSQPAAQQASFDLDTTGGTIRWANVPETLYYRVTILSDDGDLVWQERVAGTHWSPPETLGLADGMDYFVRVEARLDDSRVRRSDFVPFRIGGSRQ
jgi:hypothetical protein